jgi:hypothetical protein
MIAGQGCCRNAWHHLSWRDEHRQVSDGGARARNRKGNPTAFQSKKVASSVPAVTEAFIPSNPRPINLFPTLLLLSHPLTPCYLDNRATMSLASKSQSLKIFDKLKAKPANKVRLHAGRYLTQIFFQMTIIWRRKKKRYEMLSIE